MKKSKLIVGALVILIGLPVAAVGAVYAFVDPNDYRAQIAEALSKQLGRTVKLDGPIKLSLSWSHGVDLSVSDVSVANAQWATRPVLAKIGQLGLGVGLQPLLEKKVEISAFKVADADILLETNAAGQTNYDFKAQAATPEPKTGKPETVAAKPGAPPVALHIDNVSVENSTIAMRGKDGKVSSYVIKSLALTNKSGGITLKFEGTAAGAAVKVDLTGGTLEDIMGAKWPFKADANYADYAVHAEGELQNAGKGVALSAYSLTAGSTKVTGQMAVTLGGSRPMVAGTVVSDKLDPADLTPKAAAGAEPAPAAAPQPAAPDGEKRMFSTAPLNLSALKMVDAKLDVTVGELPLSSMTIKKLHTKVDLNNGKLNLGPLALTYAGSDMVGSVSLDASSAPTQVRVAMKAPQLDLNELAKGMIEGKADADIVVTTLGNSMHDFASNADGAINVISGGGTIPTSTLVKVGGNLLNAAAAGAGSAKVNCFATRFKLAQGQMQSNGVLFDLDQATLLSDGTINLRDESLNLLLKTRTKVAKIDSYIPAIRVTGPLSAPRPMADTASTVSKVAGLIMGGDARTAAADNGVPVVGGPAGENACVYTLDHPTAAKAAAPAAATPTSAVQDLAGGKTKLKDVGAKLLQGLFNK